jgi:hypothetical protein
MPRPEAPITWTGPIADLALALPQVREQAGKPTYRALGFQANFSPTTLAGAAAGITCPTWEVTKAFARACDSDPEKLKQLWQRADRARRTARRRRTLNHHATLVDVIPYREESAEKIEALVEVNYGATTRGHPPRPPEGGTAEEFVRRLRALRAWAGQPNAGEITRRSQIRLAGSTMYDALRRGRTRLPSLEVTQAIAAACAPDPAAAADWVAVWRTLKVLEAERGDL